MQLETLCSMVPLQNVVIMGGGALAYLSLRRKMGFLSQLCGVSGPGKVLANVHHPGRWCAPPIHAKTISTVRL